MKLVLYVFMFALLILISGCDSGPPNPYVTDCGPKVYFCDSGPQINLKEACNTYNNEALPTTYDCLLSLAIERNSLAVCGQFGDLVYRSRCYSALAINNDNPEPCDEIKSLVENNKLEGVRDQVTQIRDTCYKEVAE